MGAVSNLENAELFDVLADPTESKNIAEKRPEIAARLKEDVIAWDRAIGQ